MAYIVSGAGVHLHQQQHQHHHSHVLSFSSWPPTSSSFLGRTYKHSTRLPGVAREYGSGAPALALTMSASTASWRMARSIVLAGFAASGSVHSSPVRENFVRPVGRLVSTLARMLFARAYSPFWIATLFTLSMTLLGMLVVCKMDAEAEAAAALSVAGTVSGGAGRTSATIPPQGKQDQGARDGFGWNIQTPAVFGTREGQVASAPPAASISELPVPEKQVLAATSESPSLKPADSLTGQNAHARGREQDQAKKTAEKENRGPSPPRPPPTNESYTSLSAWRKIAPWNSRHDAGSHAKQNTPLEKPRDWSKTLDRRNSSKPPASNPTQTSVVQQYYLPKRSNSSVYDFMRKKNKWN